MNAAHLLLAVLLPVECYALFIGQRRLFFAAQDALRSKLAALLLAAPGTILHELAHFLACLILRVPAGRDVVGPDGKPAKVEFFRPRRDDNGQGITLGQVPHAATDPLRGALIAIAPVLLVPPLLFGLSYLLLGAHTPADIPSALVHATWWKVPIWALVALSCGQAAFPSPGDHVGVLGGVCLATLAALIVVWSVQSGGVALLVDWLAAASLLLAVPAAAAAGCLGLFWMLRARRLAAP